MTEKTFICALCGGEFVSNRPDAEAHAEAKARYGKDGLHPEMAVVCDDCYEKLTEFEERVIRQQSARNN